MNLANVHLRKCKKISNLNKLLFSKDRQHSTQPQSVWKGVIGLEVHAQIDTVSKLFSGASTSFQGHVNNNVSLFDAAIPGTLPVLNKGCVEAGVLTALALDCRVNPVSSFDRKHYFYADLPAGYQITQQRKALANDGILNFEVFQGGTNKAPYKRSSRIRQLQLEQDSGKSIHDELAGRSLVDLNRAGVPLMEIIFEPDLQDGEEAAALVFELMIILTRLGTCKCKMEEGSLRVDANVSVHQPGAPLGVRSEVKNIGSVRAVAKAVDYEIKRQILLLESGNSVVNETRSWSAETNKTIPMRDKEDKQDYRFMPEPNLPPLHVCLSHSETNNKNVIDASSLRERIPELPNETRQRLRTSYELSHLAVYIFVNERQLLLMFEHILQSNPQRIAKQVSNFITIEFLTFINKGQISLEECDTKLANKLGEIIDLLQCKKVNLQYSRKLIEEIINGNDQSPSDIVKHNGWEQITSDDELKRICEDSIARNPKIVAQWKTGKEKLHQKLIKAFMGDIIKATDNRADLSTAKTILVELLNKR